jgi:molybdopterin converting factor small subunit
MPATSDELMAIARAAADKIDIHGEVRQFPSFGDVEEQCEAEFDELLETLHDDDVFEAVDVQRQQELADTLAASLPEDKREMLDELIDNQARQLWLNQDAAFHLGMAVGMRLASGRRQ